MEKPKPNKKEANKKTDKPKNIFETILDKYIQIALVFFTATLAIIGWCQACQVKKSMEVSNKAYISVEEISQVEPIKGNISEFHAIIIFTNTGQTPAYDVRVRAKMEIVQSESLLTDIKNIPIDQLAEVLGKDKVTKPLKFDFFANIPNTAKKLFEKEMFIFIHGAVNYSDIFESNRHLYFRYYYRRSEDDFAFCKYGNEAK